MTLTLRIPEQSELSPRITVFGIGGAGGNADGGTVTGGLGRANNFRTGSNVTYAAGGRGVAGSEDADDDS